MVMAVAMAGSVRMPLSCSNKVLPSRSVSHSNELCSYAAYGKLSLKLKPPFLQQGDWKSAAGARIWSMAATTDRESPTAPAGKQGQASTQKIKGKTVVITGGSQGCGKEIALLFANKGYNVVVVAREPKRLQEVADKVASIRGNDSASLAVPTDVANRADVDRMASAVRDRFERVDVLINNAGICATGPFLDTPLEVWDSQMSVNVMGPVNVTHALLPDIIRSKGSLIFVNSFAGRMPLKNMAAYTSSKFALAGFVDVIALELADKGVHVAQVQPGIIDSDFLERAVWYGSDAESAQEQVQKMMKTSFAVKPVDVANAVWNALEKKKKEVVVGTSTQFFVSLNRMGINVTAAR